MRILGVAIVAGEAVSKNRGTKSCDTTLEDCSCGRFDV